MARATKNSLRVKRARKSKSNKKIKLDLTANKNKYRK